MPVVPFQPAHAPGPRAMPDPTFVMAAVADLHQAGMLVETKLTKPTSPETKLTSQPKVDSNA